MKKVCILLLSSVFFAGSLFAQQSHIPGEVMVMLHPKEDIRKTVEQFNNEHLGANFHILKDVSVDWNIWLLSFDNLFITDESALLMINRHPSVTMAQYNYPVELRVTTPNDPSFASQQWALNNTGQSGGTVDADIDAPEAWDITTGGSTVQGDNIVVAVIDGGFQNNHPDLTANYWTNTAEIPGNGIDDDGNGYVDDVNGWNAYNNNGTIPSDQHGTHVAGIIGARGNNSVGVAGVNWNVKIMRVAGSSGNSATVVGAYAYVAKQRKIYNQTNGQQGAFVVSTNSSFGVDYGDPANFPIWCAFYDTLGALGILSAGAVPNLNINIDVQGDVPGTCPSPYMIGVTNTTRTDAKNNGAGYGVVHVDLGAPGTQIYNTVTGSNYGNLTGTSMATPHVAGAIGLYYAAACTNFITSYKSNPAAGALLMREFLLTGVDSIASMANTTLSKGRLNLMKGIQRVQDGCNIAPPTPPVASFDISDNNICAGEQVTFTDQSTNTPTSWSWTFTGGSPASSIEQNPVISYNTAGTYTVILTATNAGGTDVNTQTSAITVNANPSAPIVTDNGGVFQSSYNTGNQWYGANGLIIGATSPSFTPPSNGFYYVIHTDANGCVSPASASVLLNASIEEMYFDELNVFPNPIGDAFTVSWKTSANVKNIRLYDAVGKLVYHTNNTANSSIIISTQQLAKGNYVLELETDMGSVKKNLVK